MQWYDRALNCQKIIRNDAKSDGRSQWYPCYKIRCQFGTAGPWHAFQNSIVPVTSLRRICCGRLLFPLDVVGFAQNIRIFRRLDNNRRMLDVVCTSWSGHIILTAQEAPDDIQEIMCTLVCDLIYLCSSMTSTVEMKCQMIKVTPETLCVASLTPAY